jgi:Stage II sporulation protein E (SpoIIE)
LRNGTLEYCNCGHNAPVLLPASGEPRRLATTGLPLGLFADRPAAASCVQLNPGDDLILFTDGVTEALNPSKVEFGDPLLVDTLLKNRNSTMAELARPSARWWRGSRRRSSRALLASPGDKGQRLVAQAMTLLEQRYGPMRHQSSIEDMRCP